MKMIFKSGNVEIWETPEGFYVESDSTPEVIGVAPGLHAYRPSRVELFNAETTMYQLKTLADKFKADWVEAGGDAQHVADYMADLIGNEPALTILMEA